MEILRAVDEMVAWSRDERRAGRTIGFVPTMGYLHRGHASLMDLARPLADRLVVSIYVNPLQFGPNEDLSRYPRDPDGDAHLCSQRGVDIVFMPENLYPPGFATTVTVSGVTARWDGVARPGHFDGVTTAVARLLMVVGSDVAVFGEKDWQQLATIRQMVRDLGMPVQLVPGPLVRDHDGLALSSRNKYLSPADRQRALSLSRALRAVVDAGTVDVSALEELGRSHLTVDALDYLAVVDAVTLEPIDQVDRPARVLVAARVGGTRLIDNMAVGPELSWI